MNTTRALRAATLALCAPLALAVAACEDHDEDPSAANGPGIEADVESHTRRPKTRAFDPSLLSNLRAPNGFQVSIFATEVPNARWLAVAEDGLVYVTQPMIGTVSALRDTDGDGRADQTRVVLSGIPGIHGIAFRGDRVYLAEPSTLWSAAVATDGSFGEPELVFDDLPDGAQHPNRTMAFGPDGALYLSIGSSCNACEESNREHATMLRVDVQARTRTVFARGLRNTLGFAWHTDTGSLYGMDQGSDDRGDDRPPEELNALQEGVDYGWPYAFAKQEIDPIIDNPPSSTKAARAAASAPSLLEYQAHSSPIGFVFYGAEQFPANYRGDAFIAFRGSWNRQPPSGYRVVRVKFEDGQPARFEDFVTGWLLEGGDEHFGRIAGLAVDRDGSLLIAEDTNGVVYRVRYLGDAS